jgi:hypothetical protein
LPQGYQVIFNLHAVEGFSHVEIGEMLGISDGTSRSQYSRARNLLITWIEKYSLEKKNTSYAGKMNLKKRLQEEMSEFRVRPSEVVWDRIEDDLRKKKRRRVVFYLFLLAGLSVVGYSGYVLFTPQKQILAKQDIAKTDGNKLQKQEPSTTDDTKKNGPGK